MTKKNEIQVHTENNLPVEFSALKENKSLVELAKVMPEHTKMLEVIKKNLPEIQRSTSLFGKTQSQFMDNMMTVSGNTPIRNLRQILAQMTQTRGAIKEANFNLKEKEIKARIKRKKAEKETDPDKKELLEKKALKLEEGVEDTKIYLSGAIRQLANYVEQYNSIIETHKLHNFNEEDFEKEEERYHIMKAFEQALCAARSHNGVIDEGNHIYLSQIGINGAHAQFEITQFLKVEQEMLNGHPGDPAKGIPPRAPMAPTHEMYVVFLNNMANHFAGSAEAYAKRKGMKLRTESNMVQEGDTRLSGPKIPAKVLARLKKLFALAKSPNENEASRASEKMVKLLNKHGLTIDEVQRYLS